MKNTAARKRKQVPEGYLIVGVDPRKKKYADDLKSLLDETDLIESKAFLHSFVKRIVINGDNAIITYNIPLPPEGKRKERVEVLPIETPGGAEGTRTPDFLLAKEALSRLSYSPIRIVL
jgi:site-specific DNA recombinase